MTMADAPILPFARSPSLAEQAAEAIVGGIAAGIFKPGERLVEANLAATLQMSRVPLREALKILEAQGIVASTPHRGTFIPAFDDKRIDQICEARIALEKLALRDAVAKRTELPQLLKRLDAIITTMEQAAGRLDWMGVSKADLSFHRAICDASDNAIVRTLWESLARHVLIVFGQEIRDEKDAVIMGPHHRRLRDLIAAADVEALLREIPGHILRLRGR
ncbi:GntR family transcriptional regulator [Nordella sp. HKS 07]|uniref:GntR family transcriptional regulator n=1 Tax=Nordella sp. HKS 07 TaxID=2712222 RepID=UPI0013E1843C|nr:GntR family transcriptional regulator [Nordella sp. HKS 07]QIG48472.1 GntR family transcriptional regulator [Nordella sp. HKS 07]